MSLFTAMFNFNDWTVTGFYPYTSSVTNRIYEQNHNYKTKEHDWLDERWEQFWKQAEEKNCRMDNKIVLQITKKETFLNHNSSPSPVLYIGKYDGRVSIGLGMYQDEWLKDRNKFF